MQRWITTETYEELTRTKRAERGDVLYTIVASFGIPVLIDWERPFAFQRHIALIQPDRERLLSEYLVHFLNSSLGKRQADIYAEGNAQRTITLGSLSQFALPVPSRQTQEEFIEKMRSVEAAIALCIQDESAARDFLKSFIDRTLS